MNTEDFIQKSRIVHGDLYEYSKSIYTKSILKLIVTCKIHGDFDISPNNHISRKRGCPMCSKENASKKITKTNEEFIKECYQIHDNKYDYSLVKYKNNKTKVKIICEIHGLFEQTPKIHLKGSGCPKCFGNIRLTNKEFIDRAKSIHNDKYNYDLVKYENNNKNVEIVCKTHGIFMQTPSNHLSGKGCMGCYKDKKPELRRLDKNDFIKKANLVHSNKYDYSKSFYVDRKTDINIICHKHGTFKQRPQHHLYGSGCPKCLSSKGENRVRKYLIEKCLKFEEQKTFKTLKYKTSLFYDFYLPEHNICIEYDGKQHYKIIEHFGGKTEFIKTKKKDEIKTKYCEDNGIYLIRIPYYDYENIDDILNENFNNFD